MSSKDDTLDVSISDDGKGMTPEMIRMVTDLYNQPDRTERGVGNSFIKGPTEACCGWFRIDSKPGKGTEVRARFQLSHIDRMPLGDLPDTFLGLLIGTPDVHWTFQVKKDELVFDFDDTELKNELGADCLSEPEVIRYIRMLFSEGIEPIAIN